MSIHPPQTDVPPAFTPTSSVYREIISVEAYLRHSRAIRHLKSIRRLIIPLLIVSVFCYLVITTLSATAFIANQSFFRDWDEYLSGRYIDITDSAKDCQVISIPTDDPNAFDVHVVFIFSHRSFSGISHSIENSDAKVVAIYENIDGIYNIFRFKHSDIHNAVASNDGYTDIGVLNSEPYTVRSNPLVAITIRFIQDLSLFYGAKSSVEGYIFFSLTLLLIVALIVFSAQVIGRRITVHESCLARLQPVNIYQAMDNNPNNDDPAVPAEPASESDLS